MLGHEETKERGWAVGGNEVYRGCKRSYWKAKFMSRVCLCRPKPAVSSWRWYHLHKGTFMTFFSTSGRAEGRSAFSVFQLASAEHEPYPNWHVLERQKGYSEEDRLMATLHLETKVLPGWLVQRKRYCISSSCFNRGTNQTFEVFLHWPEVCLLTRSF